MLASRAQSFGRPLSSEAVAVPGSGVSSALTIPAAAKGALVSVATAQVRWRSDGSNPTSTVGHPLDVDAYAEFGSADLVGLLFASADGATPATVFVTYYGD